jgi:translation initiation factor 1A
MAKKNSGGKNFKKQKKDSNSKQARELIYKEDEQAYARIIKPLGDSRFECECFELNENLIGLVRGAFKKRVWMNVGDIILVSFRNFDKERCDIIHKYTPDEAHTLKAIGEIPTGVNLHATALEISDENKDLQDDMGFEFEDI